MKLTNRHIIEYRITTNPADFGYGGRKSKWKTDSYTVRGSAKQIKELAYQYRNKYGLNQGTYYADAYSCPAHPECTNEGIRHDLEELEFENWHSPVWRKARA